MKWALLVLLVLGVIPHLALADCTYTNVTVVAVDPASSGWFVDFGSGKIGTEIINDTSISYYACGGGVNTTPPTIVNYQVSNVSSPVGDYIPVIAIALGMIVVGIAKKKD